MTHLFDKLLIRAGFDAGELSAISRRHVLYMGNVAMFLLCGLLLAMLVL